MITVIGVLGSELGSDARAAIDGATVVVGASRLLATVGVHGTPLDDLAASVEHVASAEGDVCVLASGDPGFFGIVRRLADRCGRDALRVLPAPSSVAVAFARLAMPWDDATVVSAHGRPLAEAARLAARSAKAAVLTGPAAPPQALGAALVDLGPVHEHAAVCQRLGDDDECVAIVDVPAVAEGTWDPLSVVLLWSGDGVSAGPARAWGLSEDRFAHRAGMITKDEVRSVALARLDLGASGVLWDIGAGSGSVAIEAQAVAPGLEAIAVERDPAACRDIVANARAHGAPVRLVQGTAPDCFAGLPDPDRVFVGGGGIPVLQAAWARLRAGGVAVATFAALDRAACGASLLGNLSELNVSRGHRLPDGGWRLAGANPVFVVWGCKP